MQSWQMAATGVAMAVVIALTAAWWIHRHNRTKELRERFGPEYDSRNGALGSRRVAKNELASSEARVHRLRSQSFSPSDRVTFLDAWRLCQAQFVDYPAGAGDGADQILTDMLR